jgi:pantothenate kinase
VSPGLARLRADDNSLVDRARAMSRTGDRVLLGITGPPASGKSTLAVRVAAAVGDTAVVVPMDGYHLHDDELARLGLSDRKGAPETFDVAGYAALLRRLRSETDHAVYAPEFDRSREESVAGAIGVHPWHRLVITEGNYLLLDSPGWTDVLPLLDETWYVEVDDDLRRERLVKRHIANGRSPDDALRWANASDQANAEVVARTRKAADILVDID